MASLTNARSRRQPTEAQKAKAAERRSAMRKLAQKISAMSQEERDAIAARIGVVTIEGRVLSVYNACMIWSQNPAATVVGGFRQWLKAGRAVCKGQRGLSIWVPCVKHDTETPPNKPDETFFVLGTVFDVSQTQEIESGKAVA